MNTHADKVQDNKSQSLANGVSQKQNGIESTFQFADNRSEAVAQRKLYEMANNRTKVKQADQLNAITNCHSDKMAQLNPQAPKRSANFQRKRTQEKQVQEDSIQVQQNTIIQRFPDTALESSADLNWGKTNSVSRPGEGVSGGVFIFNDPDGPIFDLVVKPEYDEEDKTPQSIASGQVSDKLLQSLGFNVPNSRIVKVNDAEASQILNVAKVKGNEIPLTINPGNDENMIFLKIMGKADASTFSRAAKETDSEAKVPELLAVLNRTELMNKVGQLIVADTFMRNTDRITYNSANLGNLMFHENELTAIDSSARFKEQLSSHKVNKKQVDLEQIEHLFDKREALIKSLFIGLGESIPNEQAKVAFQNYCNSENATIARSAIAQGITDGIASIRALLGNKERRRPLKEEMSRHKEAGATHMEWSRLKTAKRYVDLRAKGKDAAEAAKYSVEYEKFSSVLAQITTFPANILAIPVMPASLTGKEKLGRKLKLKSADEKRASELKKQLRKGDVDHKTIDMSTLANAGRRGDKLKVELNIRLFIGCLIEKTTSIEKLIDADNPYAAKMLERAFVPLNLMKHAVLDLESQYAILAQGSDKTKVFVTNIQLLSKKLQDAISEKIDNDQ